MISGATLRRLSHAPLIGLESTEGVPPRRRVVAAGASPGVALTQCPSRPWASRKVDNIMTTRFKALATSAVLLGSLGALGLAAVAPAQPAEGAAPPAAQAPLGPSIAPLTSAP